MKQSTQFRAFLESMTTEANSELMECIKSGFALIESEEYEDSDKRMDEVREQVIKIEPEIEQAIIFSDAEESNHDVDDGETRYDLQYDLNIQPMINKIPAEFREEAIAYMIDNENGDVLENVNPPQSRDEYAGDLTITVYRDEQTNDVHLELNWKGARSNRFGRRDMARDVGMY